MIYFISQREFIKIGFSDDVDQRIKELQTASPLELKLVGTMPGAFQTECELHKIFESYRKNGEWFRYTGHLKDCIRALHDAGNPYEVTNVRSLQKAGLHFHLREKANRLAKKGNSKLKDRILYHKT